MGCIQSDTGNPLEPSQIMPTSTLTVATLNYCGIMNSPFEFYCDDYMTELKEISRQFIALLPTYFPDFQQKNEQKKFKWEMGKIDLKFRTRYSPMFYLDAGIENNKFITRQQFEKKWDQVFQAEIPKINVKFQKQERQVTKKYDYAMFHCLLKYVFKSVDLNKVEDLSVDTYRRKLQPLYNQSFLDEKKKSQKVQANFKQIKADIFFFQEYSEGFFQALKASQEYYIATDESKDTMIIAKKSSFKEKPVTKDVFIGKHVSKELLAKLNWADRTAFLIIQKYICICAHLTSKKQKNLPQIKEMKEGLLQLKKKLPDYDIILGGDINSYLEPFSKELNFFPNSQEMTTVKKRTATQGQYHKADQIICESKDKIISTLRINEGRISYITGAKPNNDNLVPTNEHPFDHFVLVTYLEKRGQH